MTINPENPSDEQVSLWEALLKGITKSLGSPAMETRKWAVEQYFKLRDDVKGGGVNVRRKG